jgi:3-methyl-2-oxobutanoate hydroxymethyltransferase
MTEIETKIVRIGHLQKLKAANQKFACLTSYDALTAAIFDEAGIEVILVGDSAADNSLGYTTTLPITVDEMISFGRAVASSVNRALVVVDLPFGSYETSASDALANAIRVMKETGASAVKIEGGERSAAAIKAITDAGIPVMAHIGFTPQSVHSLSGFKVQGRGETADQLEVDALAVQSAGAFAVVLELIPADLAQRLTKVLNIPTIGIGGGSSTDGQILVWTDFAGLSAHAPKRFVRQYAQIRSTLLEAAKAYRADVISGNFPSENEQF